MKLTSASSLHRWQWPTLTLNHSNHHLCSPSWTLSPCLLDVPILLFERTPLDFSNSCRCQPLPRSVSTQRLILLISLFQLMLKKLWCIYSQPTSTSTQLILKINFWQLTRRDTWMLRTKRCQPENHSLTSLLSLTLINRETSFLGTTLRLWLTSRRLLGFYVQEMERATIMR